MLSTRIPDARLRLPSLCAVCRGWGMERVCVECVDRYATRPERCERCALRVPEGTRPCGACLTETPPFTRTLAAVDDGHPWDGLITHFKFHGALDLAPALTRRLPEAFERSDHPAPSLLLPVPVSVERMRMRKRGATAFAAATSRSSTT